MEAKKWPVLPTFLSLRKGCIEETADFDDGIYYPDYIRGFLADLSYDKRVQIALSMFQVVPKDFTPLDENWAYSSPNQQYKTVLENYPIDNRIEKIIGKERKIIRIDSGTFIKNGICCGTFRDCNCNATEERKANKAFCYKQDSRIGLFSDESLSSLNAGTHEYEKQLLKVIENFNQAEKNEKTKLKLKKHKKRIYVHYTCEVSLFEETMFPIYVKEKFVACLMLGQMAGENYDKSESFKKFLVENHTPDEYQKFETYLPKRKLSVKEWNDMRDAIVDRIDICETRLADKINHRTKDYLEEFFNGVKKSFKEEIKKIRIEANNQAGTFFSALSSALTTIHNQFNRNEEGFIRMFALPIDDESKRYVPIGWSGIEINNPNKAYLNKGKHYFFNISKEQYEDFSSSKLNDDEMALIIQKYGSPTLQKEFQKGADTIRVEKLLNNRISFIIWKRHSNNQLKNDKLFFDNYKEELISFYTYAFQCYSYIRGTIMEYMLEIVISMAAHESAHFILPSLDIMQNFLRFCPGNIIDTKYLAQYEKFKKHFDIQKENVEDQLKHLFEVNDRPSLIFNEVYLALENIQVFPLLYKMTKMMKGRAEERNQLIVYTQNLPYSSVYLDKKYFDHALFNLLDNAIKYGYRGSKIYIYMNMKKSSNEFEIKVVSYGQEIEKGERIYRLFERGDRHTDARGKGIGMFIVNKIILAHNGHISHESEFLSPFNIPVLSCYKEKKNGKLLSDLDSVLKQKVLDEEKNLSPNLIEEVVNDKSFIKFSNVFATRINKPTFQNVFTITIPLQI